MDFLTIVLKHATQNLNDGGRGVTNRDLYIWTALQNINWPFYHNELFPNIELTKLALWVLYHFLKFEQVYKFAETNQL